MVTNMSRTTVRNQNKKLLSASRARYEHWKGHSVPGTHKIPFATGVVPRDSAFETLLASHGLARLIIINCAEQWPETVIAMASATYIW